MEIDLIQDTSSLHSGLGYKILRLARLLRISVNNFIQGVGEDITIMQWYVLFKLHEKDGQFQTELTDNILNDRPNMTRILDGLVKNGYVTRNPYPKDRRKYLIMLSEKGRDVTQRILPLLVDHRKFIYDRISPEELQSFDEILTKIERHLSEWESNVTLRE